MNGSASTGAPARARDVGRGGVGLLAGDPALLDRERRHVAGGVDVRHAGHARVAVDDEEPVGVGGQPGNARAFEARQGDDAVDLQQIAAQRDPAGRDDVRVGRGVQDDAGLGQQPGDLTRGVGAEDRQRRRLGRHDVELERGAHLIRALGEHQRELVERQRPGAAGRDDERDPADVALLDVLDDAVQALLIGQRAGEHGRSAERLDRARARRDQQLVVRQMLPGDRDDGVLGGVDARQAPAVVREARVGGHALDRIGRGRPGGERREHAQRPVGEVGLGGEQRGRDPVTGQPMQGECGFEGGGSAADDQDVGGHA